MKKILLVLGIVFCFFGSAFAEAEWVYGSGPQLVATGGDYVVAKIVFSYIAGDGVNNCTPTAYASGATYTAVTTKFIAGLLSTGGQFVEYNFKSEYHYLKSKGTWGGNISDNRKDLGVQYPDGVMIDFGTCTCGATVTLSEKALKQDDINYTNTQ